MIDPFNLKPPIPAGWLRQEWLLFSVAVAGRNALMVANKVHEFLTAFNHHGRSPFTIVRSIADGGLLQGALYSVKMGQYGRIAGAWDGLCRLKAYDLDIAKLEAIKGIGPKTARMAMMYIDPTIRVAPLDVHILKFLRHIGCKAPKNTPPAGATYNYLEQRFLDFADQHGLKPFELDTIIWKHLASGEPIDTLYFPEGEPNGRRKQETQARRQNGAETRRQAATAGSL